MKKIITEDQIKQVIKETLMEIAVTNANQVPADGHGFWDRVERIGRIRRSLAAIKEETDELGLTKASGLISGAIAELYAQTVGGGLGDVWNTLKGWGRDAKEALGFEE